jgi:hypothetical protein
MEALQISNDVGEEIISKLRIINELLEVKHGRNEWTDTSEPGNSRSQ